MMTEDYLSLFPGASREMPRFMALAEAVLTQAVDLQMVVGEINKGFSLETASGTGLDALASSVGLSRKDVAAAGTVSDETFRAYLRAKFALWAWDGSNSTVPQTLSQGLPGSHQTDNMDGTVTAEPAGPLPVPAKDLFPVAAGVRVIV